MSKRFHDTEQVDKDFFIQMEGKYKVLLNWIEKKHDTAGIWPINLSAFLRDYYDLISKDDIDLDEFINQCNVGKIRMVKVDQGRKLFLTTTIEFQYGAKDKGYTVLNENSPIKRGILNRLRKYPETQDWLTSQIKEGRVKLSENEEEHSERMRKCGYCQKEFKPSHLQKDHIVPKSRGGDDYNDNQIDACTSCNTSKKDRDPIEFIESNKVHVSTSLSRKLNSLLARSMIESLPYANPIGKGIGIGKGIETITDSTPSKVLKRKKEKEKKKTRLYTYTQMLTMITKSGTPPKITMDDFECVNLEASRDQKRWRSKSELKSDLKSDY